MRYEYPASFLTTDRACATQGHTWPHRPGPVAWLRAWLLNKPETCRRCGMHRWAV